MTNVHLEIRGQIAEIRLDNPAKLNALTISMINALDAHAATIEDDKNIRAVLLTATGDRAFCVGADIREWSPLDARAFSRDWIRKGHRVFDRLARLAVPMIGVLNGPTFGGGLELAATCDLRIASPKASFSLPETGIGVVPGWSGTQRLARQVPPAILKEMALTGTLLSAERAFQIGFLNDVADDPMSAAEDMAACIAGAAPQATETTKWLIGAALGEDSAANIEALAGAAIAPTAELATVSMRPVWSAV